ncbi:type II toxin-antitoxin system Phd/YefM family antitoxin [Succinimonas sp.]|uniref:type II toxin-antitoxin system Phd/YefM family antitoxin n=1 Tax=Succinimonas sp. TaxID=1936151 RepID=UPI003866C8FA
MIAVTIPEAEAGLSELLQLLETKKEDVIIVTRNGRTAVKITLIPEPAGSKRIGAAEGRFAVPDDFDAGNKEIAALLMNRPLLPDS